MVLVTAYVVICKSVRLTDVWKSDDLWEGKIYNKYLLEKNENVSKIWCASRCNRQNKCLMFFYTKFTKHCQLTSKDFLAIKPGDDVNLQLHDSPGTKLYYNINKNPLTKTALMPNVTSLMTSTGASVPVCSGYEYSALAQRYYTYIHSDTRTLTDAQFKCANKGGRLALLKTSSSLGAMLTVLTGLISRFGDDQNKTAFWVAAKYFDSTGRFQWVDDNSVLPDGPPLWCDYQPKKFINQFAKIITDCVFIFPSKGYCLNDYTCSPSEQSLKFFPLCECQ